MGALPLQDVTFHQCVNLGRFNTEKVVSFVPPDGEFELMKYRCQEGISLPFRVLPIINEMGRTRLEVCCFLALPILCVVHEVLVSGWMVLEMVWGTGRGVGSGLRRAASWHSQSCTMCMTCLLDTTGCMRTTARAGKEWLVTGREGGGGMGGFEAGCFLALTWTLHNMLVEHITKRVPAGRRPRLAVGFFFICAATLGACCAT